MPRYIDDPQYQPDEEYEDSYEEDMADIAYDEEQEERANGQRID